MNLWGWITGGARSAEKGLDAIINTGDALFFTNEEKSEFDLKRQEAWLELQKTLSNESSYRSVNRRVVAWAVMFMSAFLTLITIILAILEKLVFGPSGVTQVVIDIVIGYKWPWAFTGVIVFYFGPHLVSAMTGKSK